MPRPSPQTDRVVAVINLLSTQESGATMTEIARHLEMNQSSCVHMLAALTAAGFLFREPSDRRYHLGPAMVMPGRVAARRYPELATAREEMDTLSRTFGRPCFAFSREGDHARLVHYTWDSGSPAPEMRLGDTVPMVPPLGALFLAWDEPKVVARWLALDTSMDDQRAMRYRTQLAAVRARGYAVEAQPPSERITELSRVVDDRPSPQRDGRLYRMLVAHEGGEHLLTEVEADLAYAVHAIGAPIFTEYEAVEMSFNMIGFDQPITGAQIHRIGAAVRAAADRTTAALGGRVPRRRASER